MSDKQQSEGLDLTAIGAILRRRIGLILLAVILTTAAAVGLALRQEKQYSASAQLLFRDPALDQKLFGSAFSAPYQDPVRQTETNLKLVSVRAVAARAARSLGGGLTAGDVSSKVSTSESGQSDVASITATDTQAQRAADIANAFATQYIAFRRDADRAKIRGAQRVVNQQLKQSSGVSNAQRQALQRRAEDLKVLASLQTGNAELVQTATAPGSPSSPKPKRNGLIGGFIGLLVGLGLALTREQMDRRITRPEELEETLGLPILASVPKSRALAANHNGAAALPPLEGESFRMLRANMRYFKIDREIRSVLVTSPAPKDGKSTVAVHLAVAAAETGSKCLLLEADLRAPSIAHLMGVPAKEGLTTLLTDFSKRLSDVGWTVPVQRNLNGHVSDAIDSTSSLDVVFSGPLPPNPTELLESARMHELIRQAEREYSLVIVDAPPITSVSDAIPLLNQVSGMIVVTRIGSNTRPLMKRLSEQLRNLDAPVLGVVANFSSPRDKAYYGYPYGHAEKKAKRQGTPSFPFKQ